MSLNRSMTQYVDSAFVPRRTCYRCFRPELLCYCNELRLIDNRTRVIVVQHPREQFHPLNTARIAEHSLKSSVVIRRPPSEVGAALARAGVSPHTAILFPSTDAEQLETLPPERHPREIIVVDGTWGNAKNLLRDVPELSLYRRLKFTPGRPSSYRIRKEPRADYLSTIESVAYVLRYLEPDTEGIHHLEETFCKMIDRNILARRPSESGSRFKRHRKDTPHQFPPELATSPEKLVIAYCEGAGGLARRAVFGSDMRATSDPKPPFLEAQHSHEKPSAFEKRSPRATESSFDKEPLVVYLKRLQSNETFRLLLHTERQPRERLLQHLALKVEDLTECGVSRAEGLERISNWLQPEDVLVMWNTASLQILRMLGLEAKPHLLLKGAFCDYFTYLNRRAPHEREKKQRRAWGGMEEFLVKLDLPAAACPGGGRGALRLAQTESLLRWILPFSQTDCMPDED